jgi:hypothetical protein
VIYMYVVTHMYTAEPKDAMTPSRHKTLLISLGLMGSLGVDAAVRQLSGTTVYPIRNNCGNDVSQLASFGAIGSKTLVEVKSPALNIQDKTQNGHSLA